jgi:hypothetical protein
MIAYRQRLPPRLSSIGPVSHGAGPSVGPSREARTSLLDFASGRAILSLAPGAWRAGATMPVTAQELMEVVYEVDEAEN